MYTPIYKNSFEKDVKRSKKRMKDLNKLKDAIGLLIEGKSLPKKYRDHSLLGDYKGHRELHIEPDWLLIYKVIPEEKTIIFLRTGTHSDLFR